MRKIIWSICCLFLLSAPCLAGEAKPVVRIGVIFDGPSMHNHGWLDSLQQEITALTQNEFDIQFPASKNIVADWQKTNIDQAFIQLLDDEEVDMIIALGFISSNTVADHRPLSKPVIAPLVRHIFPHSIQITHPETRIKNLNIVASEHTLEQDMQLLQKVTPFSQITFLVSEPTLESFDHLDDQVIKPAMQKLDLNYQILPLERDLKPIIYNLVEKSEVVYLYPQWQLSDYEFGLLVAALKEWNIPSFSALGQKDVRQGIMAGSSDDADFARLNRRIALNVQRILLGEEPELIPSTLTQKNRLSINMATTRAIDLWPNWDVLIDAELIDHGDEYTDEHLSLPEAVLHSLNANLELAAKDRSVASMFHEIGRARSSLFPQVNVANVYTVIDDDRAENVSVATFLPERQSTALGNVSFKLYSELDRMRFDTAKLAHNIAREEWEQLKLDIILTTAVAYLDVLRSQAFERISRDNYELTRSHYDLAKYRFDVGAANPSEVHRWEAEVAQRKSLLLKAQAGTYVKRLDLNRLLNVDLEKQWVLDEITLSNESLLTSDEQLFDMVAQPPVFREMRNFFVEEGERLAPELRQLDEAIATKERVLLANERAFWRPEITAEGMVAHNYHKEGKGADGDRGPFAGLPVEDETDWAAVLKVEFPLFTGGLKKSHWKKTRAEIDELLLTREDTVKRIGQHIRSSLRLFSASYASIGLSNDASTAAEKNLNVVVDHYTKGSTSILDLLDAQNASLVAQQSAVSAEYDFLIDYMRVQRATGQFDFLMSDYERQDLLKRLMEYVDIKGDDYE